MSDPEEGPSTFHPEENLSQHLQDEFDTDKESEDEHVFELHTESILSDGQYESDSSDDSDTLPPLTRRLRIRSSNNEGIRISDLRGRGSVRGRG